MKTTKGETKETIQNEGCTHLWRNNSTLLLLRRTLRWQGERRCPVLIKVCFTGLPPRSLIIQESLDSMRTKSARHWNAPPKTPKSMQYRAFQNRREPIRITPQHMHSRIQVKTIFLQEQGSCLPAKPSPEERILEWNGGECMLLTKKARSN